ncbi:hypothetical protein OT109_09295 [Phycisphaeraceae bacterium D3-23]
MNEFHFVDRWSVEATAREAVEVFADHADAGRWWPATFLVAEQVDPGAPDGTGRTIRALTAGFLPYRLQVRIRLQLINSDNDYTLAFSGDLCGLTRVKTTQCGDRLDIIFESRLAPQKPVVRFLMPILKPLYIWNHSWLMTRGERSIRLEIARRRAQRDGDTRGAPLPAPPQPTTLHQLGLRVLKPRWKRSVQH